MMQIVTNAHVVQLTRERNEAVLIQHDLGDSTCKAYTMKESYRFFILYLKYERVCLLQNIDRNHGHFFEQ
jgi:hypothetical protein